MDAPPSTRIPLSGSVRTAAGKLAGKEIRSWELVRELVKLHPEYGGHLAGKLSEEPGPEDGEARHVDEWLRKLDELYDRDRVGEIHGRLAILGLGRLDPALREYLSRYGLIKAIESELSEKPFTSLLRERPPEGVAGQAAVQAAAAQTAGQAAAQTAVQAESTGTLSDVRRVAGYISDSVDGRAPDLLEIECEVGNIAYVLTSKRVAPPLSLGLFGDWGSGKSFFMAKLRRYVDIIAAHYRERERDTGQAAEWCSRVVQVEFNAWHYSDANLWASIVTHLYDQLQRELGGAEPSDAKLLEQLRAEVRDAEGVMREARVELDEARDRVNRATGALKQASADHRQKETELSGLIEDLGALLSEDDRLRDRLSEAATALGYPEAARTYANLQAVGSDLRTFSGRLAAVLAGVRRPGGQTLLVLTALAVALPVGASLILGALNAPIGWVGRRVVELCTLLVPAIAWLRAQFGRGLRFVRTIEEGLARARRVREQRIEQSPGVRQAREAVVLAQSEEQAAQENLREAQARLQQLRGEMEELRPDRTLFRLIEVRGRAATYTQHLGIISLIRSDFQKMSELLARLADERGNFKERPPIQRIILYIDDLDRCRPDRVVQVLEAVHLLLAFPLFIVVVGVDPRWLRHSLAKYYPDTLTEDGPDGSDGVAVNAPRSSTPQDYLEKIFQIPFALRSVERGGYAKLVAELLKPLSIPSPRATGAPAGGGAGRSGSDGRSGPGVGGAGERTGAPGEAGAAGEAPRQEFVPLAPEQLMFTGPEEADIARLWPLFRTPRTVKRFINTYRLLRAGLEPGAATARFEGTVAEPGEYQVALLLLAVVTGAPNEAEAFLDRLGAWLDSTEPHHKERLWYWPEVLDALEAHPVPGDPRWAELMADLRRIAAGGFGRGFTKETMMAWARRVARYSFSVRPFRGVEPGSAVPAATVP